MYTLKLFCTELPGSSTSRLAKVLFAGLIACSAHVPAGPLHDAVLFKDYAELRRLIEEGANIDQDDPYFGTPLMWSIRKHNSRATQMLIDAGANLDAQGGKSKRTALEVAIELGKFALANRLVYLGADVNVAMDDAASKGNRTLVRMFLARGGDPNGTSDGGPVLFAAITSRQKDVVALLLASGAEVNPRRGLPDFIGSSDGITPLQHAVKESTSEVVELLLAYGANVNARTPGVWASPTRWTPLHLAVLGHSPELTRLLLSHGADVDPKDAGEMTPLHWAVWLHAYYAADNTHAGVGPNMTISLFSNCFLLSDCSLFPNFYSNRVLSEKIRDGDAQRLEIAKMLLSHGADVEATDKWGRTPANFLPETKEPSSMRQLLHSASEE